MTVSLGVGTVVPTADDPMPFIEAVDQRLYAAKQRGRDCIVDAG